MGLTLLLLRLRALDPARYTKFVESIREVVESEEDSRMKAICLYDLLATLPPVESAT